MARGGWNGCGVWRPTFYSQGAQSCRCCVGGERRSSSLLDYRTSGHNSAEACCAIIAFFPRVEGSGVQRSSEPRGEHRIVPRRMSRNEVPKRCSVDAPKREMYGMSLWCPCDALQMQLLFGVFTSWQEAHRVVCRR